MSRVYEIAAEYVERFAALHPNQATAMGVPGHDDELTDFSPAGHEARIGLGRETLAALEAAPLEDERDRVARDAMVERLGLTLELDAAGQQYRSLNVIGSPVQSIRRVFDLMPRETEEHWRNIATRLSLVPQALQRFRETLDAGIERGTVSARRQATACAEHAAVWSRGREGAPPFFETFVRGLDESHVDEPALRTELEAGADFDLKAFHAQAFDLGPMGLAQMRRELGGVD